MDDDLDDEPYGIAVGPAYTIIPDRFDELYVKAACKGADTAKWFTGTHMGPNRQVGEGALNPEAIAVCHRCPVKKLCGEFAIETEPAFGIYGGRPACDWKRVLDGKPMRRTCEKCGRRRLDKFFLDDDTPICEECLSLPPDDDMADMMGHMSEAEISVALGVSQRGVQLTMKRLIRAGYALPAPRWWHGGGRPRTVPVDDVLEEAFQEGVSMAVLAERWNVTRSTVHSHKRRLAS